MSISQKDAEIITDEWNGYLPIKKDYPNLTQRNSEKGSNFPDMHIHIINIKGGAARHTPSL